MPSSTFEHCRYEADGPILTLTINRPQVLNALHPEAHDELARAFDNYAADATLRVCIITAAGERAFCVGTDLKELARTGDHRKPASGFGGITHRFDLFKPVIAAVNGLCLGGGMEILAACDIAVAAEHARFGLPEPRVGLAALGGGLPIEAAGALVGGIGVSGAPGGDLDQACAQAGIDAIQMDLDFQ